MPLENQTSLEITLDIPFTIKSDGKQKVVSINEAKVPAYYEYRSVPKLEKAAFLIARVADWSEYNLLEGEANLYFESTLYWEVDFRCTFSVRHAKYIIG